MKTLFLTTIERIIAAAGLTERFWQDEHFHVAIPNGGYMDLVIEAWTYSTDPLAKRRISVAHYYKQAGDLIADPEVEVNELGQPIELTQAPPGGYSEVRWASEKGVFVNTKADKDVQSFLTFWARNLKAQGFIEAAEAFTDQKQGTPGQGHEP